MTRIIRCLIAVSVLATTLTSSARAQSRLAPEPAVSRPLLMGAGIGLAGFLSGAMVGYSTRNCGVNLEDDFCGFPEAFYGAAVGGTFGLALGVHLGNRSRGNLLYDLLAGAAIWGLGVGAVALNSENDTVVWSMFVAVPIAQMISTVAIERATGRARERRNGVSLSIAPRPGGGMALRLGMPLPRIR